jgi:hypothetical protein
MAYGLQGMAWQKRTAMRAEPIIEGTDMHAVEVSGWDTSENFFVEHCSLECLADGQKQIRLRHSLEEGTMVFVRVAHVLETQTTHPVPCLVTHVDAGRDGRVQSANLKPLHDGQAERLEIRFDRTKPVPKIVCRASVRAVARARRN